MRRLKVFFDGGCRSGRMEAAVVAGGRTTILPDLGTGTSGEAEWLALIHALTIARALGRPDFVLLGDSADVVAKASGRATCRGDAIGHYERYRALWPDTSRPPVRRVRRSQNLAGIVLGKLHAR